MRFLRPLLLIWCLRTITHASELQEAAARGDVAGMRTLLASGAVVDEFDRDGSTALHKAITAGTVEGVRALLAAGANPRLTDSRGQTPFGLAAAHTDVRTREALTALLLTGASLRLYSAAPWSLEYAARRGQRDVVKMLLTLKVDVNQRGEDGNTALHSAALKAHEDIIRTLIGAGASPTVRSNLGYTPLHDAALGGSPGIVEALLAAGAPIDSRVDETGATALHLAASWGKREVVAVLVARGASLQAKDKKGVTPWRAAVDSGNTEIALLLKQP